jgi:hypothetical protein
LGMPQTKVHLLPKERSGRAPVIPCEVGVYFACTLAG